MPILETHDGPDAHELVEHRTRRYVRAVERDEPCEGRPLTRVEGQLGRRPSRVPKHGIDGPRRHDTGGAIDATTCLRFRDGRLFLHQTTGFLARETGQDGDPRNRELPTRDRKVLLGRFDVGVLQELGELSEGDMTRVEHAMLLALGFEG